MAKNNEEATKEVIEKTFLVVPKKGGDAVEMTLEQLLEKYPQGKLIVVPEVLDLSGEVKHPAKEFFLRKPDRVTQKFAMAQTINVNGNMDNVTPGETVITKCWIVGDEEIRDKDEYFIRACYEASTFLNEVTGFL